MKFTRFVGVKNRNTAYREALGSRSVRKMDLRPDRGNMTLDFKIDGQPLAIEMPPAVRDFLDLAAIVYTADELAERSSAKDRWSRAFEGIIPVHAPAAWRRVSEDLSTALHFLSGDDFEFEWVRTSSVPALRNHREQVPDGFDCVCLFSGGADSLVGAYRLLEEGRSVLLVGHYADGITSSTQDTVYAFLKKRFGDRVAFIQARVARSPRTSPEFELGPKVETTHRPRSFLFLALAVAVAVAGEIDEIVIPENGLIALNSPLDISRVGTLSTRTAHPRFVGGFLSLVRELGIFDGRIHNPFLYLSKTDVVRLAPRVLRPTLVRTLSCSHLGRNRWTGFRGHNCGYCVPCLYRRVAFAAINADAPNHYYRNVFTRFDSLSNNERADVRGLSGFARRVLAMSTPERMSAALAHGATDSETLTVVGPSVPDPYQAWSEMLERWAREFMETTRAWASRDVRARLRL